MGDREKAQFSTENPKPALPSLARNLHISWGVPDPVSPCTRYTQRVQSPPRNNAPRGVADCCFPTGGPTNGTPTTRPLRIARPSPMPQSWMGLVKFFQMLNIECMYHLVQNFKKRYNVKVFDDHLWASSYSWSPYMFEKHYQTMATAKLRQWSICKKLIRNFGPGASTGHCQRLIMWLIIWLSYSIIGSSLRR